MPKRPLAIVPAWRWWTGFGVILSIAACLSMLAYGEKLPAMLNLVPQFDKAMHFTVAGLLAFFLDGALRRRALFEASRFSAPVAAVVILLPAALEEYAQRFTSTRASSLWDFAADLAGVVVLIPLSRRAAQ